MTASSLGRSSLIQKHTASGAYISREPGFAVTCRDSSGIRQRYPFWAKDPSIGLRTVNAKAEAITTAPAFREAFEYRRCLVPADPFYQWQKLDAKTKQPFAIAMKDGKLYAFAGLWESGKIARQELVSLLLIPISEGWPSSISPRRRINRLPVSNVPSPTLMRERLPCGRSS
jgi:hypothetical protein